MGLQMDITDEKIRELCINAYNEHIGARGLKTVFDKYFEDALYRLLLEAEDTVNKKDEEDKENV